MRKVPYGGQPPPKKSAGWYIFQLSRIRKENDELALFAKKLAKDLKKTESDFRLMKAQIRRIARLRQLYGNEEDAERCDELAVQIGRYMDELFHLAGFPVETEQKSEEKVVVLSVKREPDYPFDGMPGGSYGP